MVPRRQREVQRKISPVQRNRIALKYALGLCWCRPLARP